MTQSEITFLVVFGLGVWFDGWFLADLARTNGRDLRYLNRTGWALLIVLSFPIGPVLYLMRAKVPRP